MYLELATGTPNLEALIKSTRDDNWPTLKHKEFLTCYYSLHVKQPLETKDLQS